MKLWSITRSYQSFTRCIIRKRVQLNSRILHRLDDTSFFAYANCCDNNVSIMTALKISEEMETTKEIKLLNHFLSLPSYDNFWSSYSSMWRFPHENSFKSFQIFIGWNFDDARDLLCRNFPSVIHQHARSLCLVISPCCLHIINRRETRRALMRKRFCLLFIFISSLCLSPSSHSAIRDNVNINEVSNGWIYIFCV